MSNEKQIARLIWKNHKNRENWAKKQVMNVDEMIIENKILSLMTLFENWLKSAKTKKQKDTLFQMIDDLLNLNNYFKIARERLIFQTITNDDLSKENIRLRQQIEKLKIHNTEIENKLNKLLKNEI